MEPSTEMRPAHGEAYLLGHVIDKAMRRTVGAVSRRGSLMTLGGAALATAIAKPPIVQAGKIAKKARKRSQKKCKEQVDACRTSLTALCAGEPECETTFLPCCSDLSDCKAGKSLDCFFAQVN